LDTDSISAAAITHTDTSDFISPSPNFKKLQNEL
jgi:hypothetical protein